MYIPYGLFSTLQQGERDRNVTLAPFRMTHAYEVVYLVFIEAIFLLCNSLWNDTPNSKTTCFVYFLNKNKLFVSILLMQVMVNDDN